jgi:cytochrome c553
MRQRSPRVHNDAHLDFIRGLPCVSCGNDIETQAAHLRSDNLMYGKTSTGMQQKPDDRWTLPLCGRCHDVQHKGNEKNFWANLGINPWVLALSLHAATGNHELAQEVISRQVLR